MTLSSRLPEYFGSLQTPKNLSGLYRGRVEDNKDPNRVGRVRVRIPLLHGIEGSVSGFIQSDNLPWATPSFMGAGAGFGSFVVPEVGEYVFILFEGNSMSSPVYIGSCYGYGAGSKPYGSIKKEADGNYGGVGRWESESGITETPMDAQKDDLRPTKRIIYKSPKGASVEIEDKDGIESISMVDMLGQVIKIESNVSSESNSNNKAQRLLGDIESNVGRVLPEYENSRILIMGSGKQKVEMVSTRDGGESCILLSNRDVEIKLVNSGDSVESDYLEIRIGSTTIVGNKDSLKVNSDFFRVAADAIRLVGEVTVEEE